ncbi:hypothetical protein QJS04_geneDACA017505 [Acorus gramineus]|uniref:ABC1 atypical kinase-like domain-containing protein n=1 Tax=Acorus gramineus TaxID=55184 RepID=A0AAV9AGV9_ACOGR|nr:hypothetical protein QJS04_geneDACA017505 [Acorus gramineus]
MLRLCEANKGFYVKAGQFISSMRRIPKEYSVTLSSLQDQAIPFHFEAIKKVIINNLHKEFSELFLSFDEQPVAAASIAQVHHALLKDKQEVAIKVFPDYRFDWAVSEFEKTIAMELDFVQEAKNSERTAKNFEKKKFIRVPCVYWDLTTKQVLTMQFCDGHKVDDVEYLKEIGINPAKVAKALVELFAEMIFVHGFLHGDPHPDSHKIQDLGEKFGVGKYSRYFPVIFMGRTIDSKSAIGREMSLEEKSKLKHELKLLKMDDISSFMESLPTDFLAILRADGHLRSIISKLGAPQHVRLLSYAKYAVYGLTVEPNTQSDYTISGMYEV